MVKPLDRRSFLAAAAGAAAAPAATTPPNIIVIYCDDLGYGDVGCYGSSLRTPNIDRLANEGTRFTHFYSGNPVCSPSRAALLTGRYPVRAGVPRVLFPRDTTGLPDSEVTIAQMLKKANYRTLCVGKWHLGHLPQFLPTNRGFDSYFGIPYSNDMNPRWLMEDTRVIEEQATLETLTPRYTERAVQFIEKSKGSPFFLYMPHTYPHIPLAASDRFRGRSPQGIYGDVVEEIDWSIGQLLDAVRRAGADSNTLLMFSSDNGPWYQGSAGRLRGRKGSTWEGGQRVPFLARFPGRIPKGKVNHGIASVMDLLPTIGKLCGATLPGNPLDGIDIWPLLSGARRSLEREPLLMFDDMNLQCARWSRWKIHTARHNVLAYSPAPPGGKQNLPLREPELYDLEADPDESYDVADKHPTVVAELRQKMDHIMAGMPEAVRNVHKENLSKKAAPTATGAVARPGL
ncbi:MAG: sulfatase [Acidimicrobiia bacterium]|nr:sulfatase [Acidimicrobiia bacterium]